jgi:transposase
LIPIPALTPFFALDENGASLGQLIVANTPEGLIRLHEFGARFFPRRWAVEGAGNHFIAAFVAELLAGSESAFSIPPSLTSQYRARRGRKKSDVIDAENVARALLANPKLPERHAVDC